MTQTFYVDPTVGSSGDGSSGSPFKSVRDAQTALETAFDTATEDYVINLLAGEDTQQFASGAWTIGAGGSARTLRFIASGADRHTGVRGTGYRNSNASGLSWVHSNTSVTLEVVGVSAKYLQGGGSTSTVTVFDSCLSTDAAGDAVTIRGGTGTIKNCAAYQFAGDGFVSVNDVSTPTTKWINCTAIGGAGNGYRRYAGTATAKNCYSGGNTTAPYSGTIGKTNCAHDTAAVITGSTASVAYSTANFTNVTSGAQDGKLPSGSALIGAGVGPSSDADIPATDFEGDTRSGTTTDIGFDQRVVAGNPLAGTAVDVASASAALSTQVKLGAAAADTVSVTAAISTAIRLAAAAIDTASASGAFATGALLAASALDVAVAVGALSTAIRANGQAADVATASGTLTNWASVTLAGTLYTGQGGALDPNFWIDSAPVLGTTLYYDATHITIYPNGEISSDVANCAAVVQFFDGIDWALGLIVFTDQLAAVAKDSVTATAAMSTQIHLAAAANALATVTAAFSTGAGLTGSATDVAAATGALSTRIPLSALASDVSTAVGVLTTQIKLLADASAESQAHGTLNGIIAMQAAAATVSSASAALTAQITPAAAAQAQASGAASLTTQINASASAADIASAAAALNSSIVLVAHAASTASSAAALTTSRPLVGAAIDVATAIAVLSTGIDLSANAKSIATATADLTAGIAVFADAAAQSTATAVLTDIIDSPPIDAYSIDSRFVISRSMVDEEMGRRTPRFITKDPLDRCVLCFDFADQLEEGEKLTGRVTLSVAAIAGNDPSATGILVGVPSYDSTQTKILQPIFGGMDGCKYYVKLAASTTNASKAVSLAGLLPVAS